MCCTSASESSTAEHLHDLQVTNSATEESVDASKLLKSGTNATLLAMLTPFADFDSFELAQSIAKRQHSLDTRSIDVIAIGIGSLSGAQLFAHKTGFPSACLYCDPDAGVHKRLNLYGGLFNRGGLPGLLLMCAGIGSPGTLREVARGYVGDKTSEQIFQRGDTISFESDLLPQFDGGFFEQVGEGFLRPMEGATKRLQNMVCILKNWNVLLNDNRIITQRGGVRLLDSDGSLIFSHNDEGILRYADIDMVIKAYDEHAYGVTNAGRGLFR
jgi:hypothetical protein